MEDILYKLNPWWDNKKIETSHTRPKYLSAIESHIKSKEIIFLTGLRRVGKTTILLQYIEKLLISTKPESILFVNLDTFALLEYTIHDIIEEYRKIHKKSTEEFFYLFLDEVTSKPDFEKELKSLYDVDNVKIICTSSIATMMRDKKARLTGRTITIEIMPLTFTEFLTFKEVTVSKSDKSKLEGYFRDYLRIGGMPQYVLTEKEDYLNETVQNIIHKDIISQYNISSERVIKELFVLLCERIGKTISYSKLANTLSISIDSVKRYIGYFEASYLFYIVHRYSKSPNENITSPKKIYAGDVGIRNIVTGFRDLGAIYENLVFLQIKHKNPFYYLKDGVEIDFITKNVLIEAKYGQTMNEKQQKLFDTFSGDKKIASGVEFFMTD
ncbi:MAG: ATP-binding protein [Candidatus Woesearchaeota archaeon]